MRNDLIIDLAACTDVKQAWHVQASKTAHGTAILLVLLLAAACIWMAWTRANLVVQAMGRIRPATSLGQAFDGIGEEISCEIEGRVIEVTVAEGDKVSAKDVLFRVDTERLDNQIEKLQLKIQAGEEEFATLDQYSQLLAQQHVTARQKAEAELTQVRNELRMAQEQRVSEIRLLKLELDQQEDKKARTQKLLKRGLVSEEEWLKVATQADKAREQWRKAQLPVDSGGVKVLERALDLVQHKYEVERNELVMRQREKQTQVEANRVELANLQLQREQSVVYAPRDGVVTKASLKVGDIIRPGKVGIAIAQQRGFEFEAAVASEDVAHLRAGMASRIKLDSYYYQQYGTVEGRLRFVSPDSEVNQGIAMYKVRIELAQDEIRRGPYSGPIKLGMTGRAEIVTGRESILVLLVRQIRQTISLG